MKNKGNNNEIICWKRTISKLGNLWLGTFSISGAFLKEKIK
jgi:hypothetical protein